MSFSSGLQEIVLKYPDAAILGNDTSSPQDVSISFYSPPLSVEITNLHRGDEEFLARFGETLGHKSKELFCPYPWGHMEDFPQAVEDARKKSREGIDASYTIHVNGRPAGHFFLWKAGGNRHSRDIGGVEVPELGIAIGDEFHGRGLGGLGVRILKKVAHELGRDAIELTTAMDNDGGFALYEREGFTYTGDILNPLEVDVTDAVAGDARAAAFRAERQMVYLVDPAKEKEVMAYLATKREESERMFSGE